MAPLLNMPSTGMMNRYASQARQALRVLVGAALSYAAYRVLHLPQGYWAVFTVIIVLQGSIASTLGAAIDRLVGTIAGALIGGAATIAIQHGDVNTGVALTLVTGLTAFGAAVRPQLKVAPVTAAILLLTQPAGAHTGTFVVDRIVEIALGGFIGVAVSVLIFPARSQPLVIERAAAALEHMQRILGMLADALEKSEPPPVDHEHLTLRNRLVAVEAAASDAERERASGLAFGMAPPMIGRALWRIRNDIILVVRAMDPPLPAAIGVQIVGPAVASLRAEAAYALVCATSLRTGAEALRPDGDAYLAFQTSFGGLRKTGLIRSLEFAEAGRVFGLAFAMEVLHRDLTDFGDRLGKEAAAATAS
jgi:hypothetical protein